MLPRRNRIPPAMARLHPTRVCRRRDLFLAGEAGSSGRLRLRADLARRREGFDFGITSSGEIRSACRVPVQVSVAQTPQEDAAIPSETPGIGVLHRIVQGGMAAQARAGPESTAVGGSPLTAMEGILVLIRGGRSEEHTS